MHLVHKLRKKRDVVAWGPEIFMKTSNCIFLEISYRFLSPNRVSEPAPEFVRFDANNQSCSGVNEDLFMHFLRPVDVGSGDLPWTGLLTGMFIR